MKKQRKRGSNGGYKQQLYALGSAVFWLSMATFLLVFFIQFGMENGEFGWFLIVFATCDHDSDKKSVQVSNDELKLKWGYVKWQAQALVKCQHAMFIGY